MELKLAAQNYQRAGLGGPDETLVNMFVEQMPDTDGRGAALISRPGMVLRETESKRIDYFFSISNGSQELAFFILTANLFLQKGERETRELLDHLDSIGTYSHASVRGQVAICSQPTVNIWDGQSVIKVEDPSLPHVSSITQINHRFVVSERNSDRFYWSDLLDGTSWNAVNFLTAESSQDFIVRVWSDGQRILAFGEESLELFAPVQSPQSDADVFAPMGASFKKGLAAFHGVAQSDDTVLWLAHDRSIQMLQGSQISKISNGFMDDLLRRTTSDRISRARAFCYDQNGHRFFVLTIPHVITMVYDLSTGQWHRRRTSGLKTWLPDMHMRVFGKDYVAKSGESWLYELDETSGRDGDLPIVREFSASLPQRGVTGPGEIVLDGFASEAGKVQMQYSDNGGRTWSARIDRNLTSPENPDTRMVWRRLGAARSPERLFRFRVPDQCSLIIRGARLDEGVVR